MAITQGVEEIGKGVLREVVKQSGATVVKVGASTAISVLKGLGIGLAIQGALSPIIAEISTHWEKEPYLESRETGWANNGLIPSYYNVFLRKNPKPSEKIDFNEKRKNFEYFCKKRAQNVYDSYFIENIEWKAYTNRKMKKVKRKKLISFYVAL